MKVFKGCSVWSSVVDKKKLKKEGLRSIFASVLSKEHCF